MNPMEIAIISLVLFIIVAALVIVLGVMHTQSKLDKQAKEEDKLIRNIRNR